MFQLIKNKLKLAQRQLMHRLYINPKLEGDIIQQFHKLYYDSHVAGKTWSDTWWRGHQLLKCPLDLWLYQEILFEVKPDLIIECGTYKGSSAFYLANMCDLIGQGEIVTIDIEEREGRPSHPRITYLTGSTIDPSIVAQMRGRAAKATTVLVILDSDHSRDHVLAELEAYASLVTLNSYVIVEDSNLNGHPVWPEHGPGPMEAIDLFLPRRKEFIVDETKHKFLLTFNPRGYLKRIR